MPKRKEKYDPLRQARKYSNSEEQLKKAGGKRIQMRLQPEANSAMEKIVAARGMNQTEAVSWALIKAAAKL